MPLSLNHLATGIADGMAAEAEALGVAVRELPGGGRLLDCGSRARGGLRAGVRYAEACMGGLGEVALAPLLVGERTVTAVHVVTDRPDAACLAAQYAGWKLEGEGFFAMASGPGRALARAEDLYGDLDWDERAGRAVLCLEGRDDPPEAVVRSVCARMGIDPSALTVLLAPTACPAGSVQIAARVVETALHKLHALGVDPAKVLHASGTAPLPPPAKDDPKAIGRTNDAVLYGGSVQLLVDLEDDALAELAPKVPSTSSSDHGTPFGETLEAADWDFYEIDPLLFSPAVVSLTGVASGRTHHAGALALDVLERSFWG